MLLLRDLSVNNKALFRSYTRDDNYEYRTIQNNAENKLNHNLASLNIADNGYRKELFLPPVKNNGGCNVSYCEGDVTLVATKDKADFENILNSAIGFYIEDEGISKDLFKQIKEEMNQKLLEAQIDTLLPIAKEKNVDTKILSKDEFASKLTNKTNTELKYLAYLEIKADNVASHPLTQSIIHESDNSMKI